MLSNLLSNPSKAPNPPIRRETTNMFKTKSTEKNVIITLRDPQEIADRLKGIALENEEKQ